MNRRIDWRSHQLDEIDLVYEKAESDERIGKRLEQLEECALAEVKNNCGPFGLLAKVGGAVPFSDDFDAMPAVDKETAIKALSDFGLQALDMDMEAATIYVRFSGQIQRVLACTVFGVLNRLENLDGAINMLIPKWTLELQVPLGAKKGLIQWYVLIMLLYPWVSIKETSTNEIASAMNDHEEAQSTPSCALSEESLLAKLLGE